MEFKVTARYLKHTPDKIRPIIRLFVGKKLNFALKNVRFIEKEASIDIYKLMKSAQATAGEKEMNADLVTIKHFYCNEGPKLKRRIPRSRGRVSPFAKRLSHLSMVLTEIDATPIKDEKKEINNEKKESNGTES